MPDDALFARVTNDIYDAALEPERWSAALEGVRHLLQATAAHLLYQDHRGGDGLIAVNSGLDPDMLRAYTEHYHALDPWAKAVTPETVVPGRAVLGQSLVPHARLVRTEFYNELARPHGVTRALGGQLDSARPGVASALVVNRSDEAVEFTPDDAATMERLLPHVRRSLTIYRQLARLRVAEGALTQALDGLGVAVILVDRRVRIHSMNAAAEVIVADNDGVSRDDASLRIAAATARQQIQRLVTRADPTPRLAVGGQLDDCVAVPRPSGRRPYVVVVAPLTSRVGLDLAEGAAAALFITDPEQALQPSERRLRQLFGFTPAEARVAAALAGGLAPDGVAEAFRISINTVRWHVKRLQAKTGASTQAQLVRLLLAAGTVR